MALRKLHSGVFLKNPRFWRFGSGCREAENLIKVPRNGQKDV